MQMDHEYHNVVVTVREIPKSEHVVELAGAECKFLDCVPVYIL